MSEVGVPRGWVLVRMDRVVVGFLGKDSGGS